MNQTSINMMNEVVEKYGFRDGTVVDMGSYDINGTYKALFTGKYIGADNVPGPNVDVIIGSPQWLEVKDVDAVISGQTLERVADVPWFMAEIQKVLKPGGTLCIIVPSESPPHHYPVWFRNYPEPLLREVVLEGGFEILDVSVNDELPWKLVCCVAKKKCFIDYEGIPIECTQEEKDADDERLSNQTKPVVKTRKGKHEAE
jgi:SAM-dependent methyltransferase